MGDKTKAALISAAVTFITGALFYAVVFGEMRSNVEVLQTDVAELQRDLRDAKIGQNAKDSICSKLYESLGDSIRDGDSVAQIDFRGEIENLECKSLASSSESVK